ncbi:MAG: ROK family protein [Candidatus Acidiferrales bacterium]
MSEALFVGVDIGGTKVAAGLVNAAGEIVQHTRVPMVTNKDAATGLAAVLGAIRQLLEHSGAEKQVAAIGICSPGPLNPETGVVINPPNVPCWRNFPLADEVRRVYSVPVKVDNDANAAALAEVLWGAGRGYRNVFYAIVGTGIGTGIVFDGKIYHGRTGAAGEGGHMGIEYDGPICKCGKHGCIEFLASGPAIARRARRKLESKPKSALLELAGGKAENVTSEMVGKASSAGDAVAKEVIQETLDLLTYWLGNIVDLLEPDVIIMGGGVSSMLAPFLDDIRAHWKGAVLNPWPEQIPVVLGRYGEEAGIAGAAALCRTTG